MSATAVSKVSRELPGSALVLRRSVGQPCQRCRRALSRMHNSQRRTPTHRVASLTPVAMPSVTWRRWMGIADIFDMLERKAYERFVPNDSNRVLLEDVAGMREAKEEVVEFVDFLTNQAKYTALGAKLPKGALLMGPPGCGKTLLAKAVASEADVPFYFTSGSSFVEMIGGLGAKRVRSMFQDARKDAPCIVFIDELDALAKSRSENAATGSGEAEQTLNQMLTEMDGISSEEGVLVLGSTNRSDVLDKAIVRPGRFDRQITVTLPNLEEREEIFQVYLKKLKLEKAPETYARRLAELSAGFSGADISNFCNEAAIHAGSSMRPFISTENFMHAVEKLKFGFKKRSSAVQPHERKIFAYHEAGHTVTSWNLQHTDPIMKISILAFSKRIGGRWELSPDKYLYSSEYLLDWMTSLMAGRVTESVVFNTVSSNAADDLAKVTNLARSRVTRFGMSPAVGLMSFQPQDPFAGKPYSNWYASEIDRAINKEVAHIVRRAESIIKENMDKITILAEALLERETLNYEDIVELIGQPKYEKYSSKISLEALENDVSSAKSQ